MAKYRNKLDIEETYEAGVVDDMVDEIESRVKEVEDMLEGADLTDMEDMHSAIKSAIEQLRDLGYDLY